MKSPSLAALCLAAAGLAFVPSVQAEDLRQVFFVLCDDGSAAAQDAPIERATPTDSERLLSDLREQLPGDVSYA